ncbi:hypothetical protein DACRYDRAFT_21938 [Dacryopinax primogenitus]|uniref:F-box domain-containing protein n=1 Tax=Dacryopinax primogenitus (strain DJM 731) TaxID=1858805 RepID=M5G1X2_DACPD|nr:uncharacterized protein DACRYDRAFT_21938 [Dacryopinax primogenitus]EJU02215.1 hypothetical protein DACRYDRAFT_21938 [Dacryopinax primogenitus]
MAVLSAEVMCEILDLAVPRCDTRYNAAAGGAWPAYRELRQLCLVCRSWATYIQYRLFDHVDLGTFDARLAFLRAIGQNTTRSVELKQTTRILVLSGPIFRPGGRRDVADILSQLPNLKTVHMGPGFNLPYLPPSTYVPSNFPSVRSFTVQMSRQSSWEALHELLRKMPTLERLCIHDFNAVGPMPSVQDTPFTFRLREFVLGCPWRCISPTYLRAFLAHSAGSLEVLGLSMSMIEPGLEEVLQRHVSGLRSLALDTAEEATLQPATLHSCRHLEHLVITSSNSDLIPALPPTLRRLQINKVVFSDGQPMSDRFLETLQTSLSSLELISELLVSGTHLGTGWAHKPLDADEGTMRNIDVRYFGLRAECAKGGVRFCTSIDSDDTQWTRFHELFPMIL